MAKKKADKDLEKLLRACRRGNTRSQRELYRQFYGYAMSICLRYAHTGEEAEEILNDSFIKVFSQLKNHRPDASFKSWLRRILVNTSIDHFRKHQKHYHQIEIAHDDVIADNYTALEMISKEEIMQMVQALPPAYRMVFNLHIVEGFSHQEIAMKLGITIGTSKSNLFKARTRLKKMLSHLEDRFNEQYG